LIKINDSVCKVSFISSTRSPFVILIGQLDMKQIEPSTSAASTIN